MAVLSVLTVALAITSGVTANPLFGFGDSSDSSSFTPGAGGFGDFTPGAGGFGGGATPSAGSPFGDFTPGASIPTDIAGFDKRQEATGDFTPGPKPTGPPPSGFTPGAGGFGGAFTPGSGAFTPHGPAPTGTPPAGTPPSGAAPTGAPSKRWWIWGRADEEDGEDAASGSQPTPTGPPSGDFTPGAGGDFTAPAGGEFTPGADFTPGAGGFGGHGHHTPGAGGFGGHGHHTPGAGGDFTGAPTGTPAGAAPTSFFTRTRSASN